MMAGFLIIVGVILIAFGLMAWNAGGIDGGSGDPYQSTRKGH